MFIQLIDRLLVMIASNRISAFDVILPRPIPYKGQVLNQVAAYMLNATKDICENWLMDTPAPNVSVGVKCIPFKIEMVVRGNLTGHAWRTYSSGKRIYVVLNCPMDYMKMIIFLIRLLPLLQKLMKAMMKISVKKKLSKEELFPKQDYEILEQYALQLFARGKELACQKRIDIGGYEI